MHSATTKFHQVIGLRHLTPSAYVVRFEKKGLSFHAGQYLSLGPGDSGEKRDYSIYSPENAGFLEVLIKEVADGQVSRLMKNIVPGDLMKVEGPFGFFNLRSEEVREREFLFIASGTGIAPFHSMVLSHPGMKYRLLHGIRFTYEAYEQDDYESSCYIRCTTGDMGGDYHGRVTAYLRDNPVSPDTICYLCGNVNMIYGAFDILKAQGVPPANLHAEVYF
ncbi:MAG: hypothetical protein JW861_10270 [Bacteroidales bacterium]|nr:hypothetical protein [Bacteroidales bacterium]